MRIKIGFSRTLKLADGVELRVPLRVYAILRQEEREETTLEERVRILEEIPWSREWAIGMCKFVHGPRWEEMSDEEKQECMRNVLRNLATRIWGAA